MKVRINSDVISAQVLPVASIMQPDLIHNLSLHLTEHDGYEVRRTPVGDYKKCALSLSIKLDSLRHVSTQVDSIRRNIYEVILEVLTA